MTKKDFNLIEAELKRLFQDLPATRQIVAIALGEVLAKNYPSFDYDRWMKALTE